MKQVLITLLISLIGSLVTKENVAQLLNFIYDLIEKETDKSDTQLDDEALDIVWNVLNKEAIVNEVTEFLEKKIKSK